MSLQIMRFDIYGRYELEILREDGRWSVHRIANGRRRAEPNLIVPSEISGAEIETYLDDLLHENARPGQRIKRLD